METIQEELSTAADLGDVWVEEALLQLDKMAQEDLGKATLPLFYQLHCASQNFSLATEYANGRAPVNSLYAILNMDYSEDEWSLAMIINHKSLKRYLVHSPGACG